MVMAADCHMAVRLSGLCGKMGKEIIEWERWCHTGLSFLFFSTSWLDKYTRFLWDRSSNQSGSWGYWSHASPAFPIGERFSERSAFWRRRVLFYRGILLHLETQLLVRKYLCLCLFLSKFTEKQRKSNVRLPECVHTPGHLQCCVTDSVNGMKNVNNRARRLKMVSSQRCTINLNNGE